MSHPLFARLESFYDAVPRDRGRAEPFGSLVLFVTEGPSYPFYARPTLGAPTPTAADIATVRARQRALGVPEALEWVDETTPALLPIAEAAGLAVLRAPLLVLDVASLAPRDPRARLLDPSSATFASDLAVRRAIAEIGFAAPGTAVGDAGTVARDAALKPIAPAEVAAEAERVRTNRAALAVAASPGEDAEATGGYQRVDRIAEIVGVATLPSARRRGLGAAVTGALAHHALETGADLVFISAGSEEIARVYERLGFRRVGTACIAEPA